MVAALYWVGDDRCWQAVVVTGHHGVVIDAGRRMLLSYLLLFYFRLSH